MPTNKQVIQTDAAPLPVARYSQAIRVGDTLYVQGMFALTPGSNQLVAGGIREQTERVFQNIQAVLRAANMDLRQVVKVTALLADMKDFAVFNEIYNRHFSFDPPPVRTTVQVGLPLGALLEIEVMAVDAA